MVIRIKKSPHLVFYCLMSLLASLLFVKFALGFNIPKIALTAVIVLIAILGDRNELLAVSLSCIPLHEAVDFYVALFACTVCLMAKSFRSVKVGPPVALCGVIILWEVLHIFEVGFNCFYLNFNNRLDTEQFK